MKRLIVFTFFLAIIGGGVFLSTRTITSETKPVEKVLPNAQFIK